MQTILLGRRLLRFEGDGLAVDGESIGNLSAVAWQQTASGPLLWLGGDEAIRFGASGPAAAGAALRNALLVLRGDGQGGFALADVVPLAALLPAVTLAKDDGGDELEIDIEGIDCHDGWLWLTGSHSAKRRRPKKGRSARLVEVETEPNRFLIARIPVDADGRLGAEVAGRRAAALPLLGDDGLPGNPLTRLLAADGHLAPFLAPLPGRAGEPPAPLPGKDNGFDIEGLAVTPHGLWLGMRGPVLRGYAVLLLLRPEQGGDGQLRLGALPDGGEYRKIFLNLRGMGVRDLAADGDDLLILAGPTMDVDGTQAVWRLRAPGDLAADSLVEPAARDAGGGEADGVRRLERLFDLPAGSGDRAEGLCRFDIGSDPAVLVVYDQTAPARHAADAAGRPIPHLVYADQFRLPLPPGG